MYENYKIGFIYLKISPTQHLDVRLDLSPCTVRPREPFLNEICDGSGGS